jgi:hypothetical protein
MKVPPKVAANALAHTPPESTPPDATAVSVQTAPAHSGSFAPILAGMVLLAGALMALHLTWRAGRA